VSASAPPDLLAGVLAEHADLEHAMQDPTIHHDQTRARTLAQRYSELTPIVETAKELQAVEDDLAAAREFVKDDESFRDEIDALAVRKDDLTEKLRRLLLPTDPLDDKDVILEIKAGEGGEESALFAGDLLRMYLRFAERNGLKTEILDTNESDLGGFKDVTVALRSRKGADGAWSQLKYEGGVHRVQRVPATESQGRIHTSAAGVLVSPEAEDVEVHVDPGDLRIDVFRSSGPGGQSVNTTDSAVRITHLPTGIVVTCQDEKSQLKNKNKAMLVLRSRLLDLEQAKHDAEMGALRRGMVQTGDRSEKIRTYNFPQDRVTDHRINVSVHNLPSVMEGNIDGLIDQLSVADQAEKLSNVAA